MIRFALVLTLLLGGCKLPGSRDTFDRTPNGWHVHWVDQGSLARGAHSKGQVLELFDAAMERSFPECALKVGLPEAYVRKTIKERDALYTLVDNFYFAVDPGSADAPDAVYATGCTYGRTHTTVAFYNKSLSGVVDPATIAPQVLPWTIKYSPKAGLWYWGFEMDGDQYPALGYELHWQFTEIP